MAKWTAKQFGVSANGVSKINGQDTVTSTTASTLGTESGKVDGMANSLATQSGQTNMGDSRATSGGNAPKNQT